MSIALTLPAAFADLMPHIEWALPTETQRLRKREHATQDEIRAFYDAMLARIDDILACFDAADDAARAGQPETAETRTLYLLMLAFADASLSVELHRSPSVPDGMPWDVWKPEHETPGWLQKPRIRLFPAPTRATPAPPVPTTGETA